MKKTFYLLPVLLILSGCTKEQKSEMEIPKIPIKEFFRNPEKTGFALSPDGKNLAFMAPVKQRLNVFVQPVGSDDARQVTFETKRDIAGFMWKGSNRILYMKDEGGDENFALFGLGIDSGAVRSVGVCRR